MITGWNIDDDRARGSVVLLTLIFMSLLAALGVGLITLTNTERAVANNYQGGIQVLYAADALAERAISDLSLQPNWTDTLLGNSPSSFIDGTSRVTTPWNEPLDLAGLTAELQRQTDVSLPVGFNTPAWRLFAWGPLGALINGASSATSAYLVAWVADDGAEQDGNPMADSNGVVTLRIQARGPRGLCRTVQVTVEREGAHASVTRLDPPRTIGIGSVDPVGLARNLPDPVGGQARVVAAPGIRILSWREVR